MKKYVAILLITGLIGLSPANAQEIGDKSWAVGMTLAVLPANGAGLIYADQPWLGGSMLAAEALSIGLFLTAGFDFITCEDRCSSTDESLLITSIALFGMSYLADVIGTPVALSFRNNGGMLSFAF